MSKKVSKPKATPEGISDKGHLIDVIQEATGASKIASKDALDAVLEAVSAVSLKKNKKVQILGFGTFEVAKRKARTGRNPATGEPIKIKASKTVRFKPGTKLKSSI
ncbi:MAG: HU family DNA-binding protein [Phycisphaerae bacterium]|nr:HU family DNA-binding protein [Phycisphaerae bacterium]NIU09355.1 HU family DNA-binding protein [Phycisphaerae bacterium]NIX28855.1 DNA-binding protein HU [Phycisphaerae bacterium]